jgi:hypothetical protein
MSRVRVTSGTSNHPRVVLRPLQPPLTSPAAPSAGWMLQAHRTSRAAGQLLVDIDAALTQTG